MVIGAILRKPLLTNVIPLVHAVARWASIPYLLIKAMRFEIKVLTVERSAKFHFWFSQVSGKMNVTRPPKQNLAMTSNV